MSAPEVTNDGLLFVYAECGPHVTEQEFNDWYDNDHAPLRLALPDFSTAVRYKAVDGKTPSWLAIYDTTTPEVLQSNAYKSLSLNAPAHEKSIISRLAFLNRRIYHRFQTIQNPKFNTATPLPAAVVLVVGMKPTSLEKEEDVNNWYSEEHLALMSKVPGFIRARRFKLVSSIELAGKADPASPAVAFPYVTLYDWESAAYVNEPAFKEAISTPWTVNVFSEVADSELRLFGLHKRFAK
ncbi:hypothetical protein H0H87_010023 [Tephrocybe sp. NHM501043]|nr:hypothetical protein H0H87_010023 [Tephrocybe sp. NHM501043]